MIGQPLLDHFLRATLLAQENPLVVRLKLNNQLRIGLKRVVKLKCKKIVGIGQSFNDQWQNLRAKRNKRIELSAHGPRMRIGTNR